MKKRRKFLARKERSSYLMNKVLILGINGFIGRHFQEYIKKNKLYKKYSFIGTSRKKIDKKRVLSRDITFISLNPLNYSELNKIITAYKFDYIINLIGIFTADSFRKMFDINAGISMNILEIIKKNKLSPKKIVLIGSAAEYGLNIKNPVDEKDQLSPITIYGLTKMFQTKIALFYQQNFGLKINIARPFNILGKGLSPELSIGSFAQQIKKAKNNSTIYTGNLATKRDFIDVDDAIDAIWKILIKGRSGQIYNVSTNKSYQVKDILNILIKKSGKSIKVKVDKNRCKKNDLKNIYGNNNKIKKDLHWQCNNNVYKTVQLMI